MRRHIRQAVAGLAVATLAAGPAGVAAINIDCGHIRADGHKWDLSELDAKYSLAWYRPIGAESSDSDKERVARTTFDLSVCRPMSRKDAGRECPAYSHICGVEDQMDGGGGNVAEAVRTFPIAVNDPVTSKYHLDPQWTRISAEEEEEDEKRDDEDKNGKKPEAGSQRQGLRLTVHGHPDAEHQYQMAVIDFLCIDKDKSKDGKEVDEEEKRVKSRRRETSTTTNIGRRAGDEDEDGDDKEDGDNGDKDDNDDDDADRRKKQKDFDRAHKDWAAERSVSDGKGGEIRFVSYKYERLGRKKNEEGMVLRLDWDTVHACEGAADDPDLHQSSGWGFFSWLFFLSFVGVAGYFAFFAWINYTRYGRSGFDMLPHADTLRDLPQLLAEYAGKAVNTLRGGRASGGYSAL